MNTENSEKTKPSVYQVDAFGDILEDIFADNIIEWITHEFGPWQLYKEPVEGRPGFVILCVNAFPKRFEYLDECFEYFRRMRPATVGLVEELFKDLREEAKCDRSKREEKLGEIEMPFGKYLGKPLSQVPLKYLDETISVMPPTWFVRRVIEFVDLSMNKENQNK